jgi:hypothetical protein
MVKLSRYLQSLHADSRWAEFMRKMGFGDLA